MNKKLLFTLILGMFLISFASAEMLTPSALNEERQLTNFCEDATCTYMKLISIEYPNGTIIYPDTTMTKNDQTFNYSFIPDQLGIYTFKTCGDPSGNYICDSDTFKVTPTGESLEFKDIVTRLVLIAFFGLIIFFIYNNTKKINFDGWYKKIKSKYQDTNRNYVKFVLGGIGYQLMKNLWVIYYSIGFIIVTLIMDITYIFNIESIFETIKILTFIYSWSFILVGLVFLSYLQEFFKWIIEEVENENWGITNGKQ